MGGIRGRILVVDDDPDLRAFLWDLLSGHGYDVATVGDADAARSELQSENTRPELVLLDLAMPGTSGFDFLTIMRAEPEMRELPTLVISGFTHRDYAAACLDRGADDFIEKPVDGRELLARVRGHLRRERERHKWRVSSRTDPLTGLPNRRAFVERLDQEIHRAVRDCCALAVAFIDVDAFKQINDARGHAAGDQVLCVVAQGVTSALRRCDVAARWGGDEFVVALPGADRRSAADAVERARIEVLRRSGESLPSPVQVSVGVGCLGTDVRSDDAQAALHLVDASDRAMYVDKRRRDRRRLADGTPARVLRQEGNAR